MGVHAAAARVGFTFAGDGGPALFDWDGWLAEGRARLWAGAWDTAHFALRAKACDAAKLAAWVGNALQARLLRDIF